jgi:hypothetical protein
MSPDSYFYRDVVDFHLSLKKVGSNPGHLDKSSRPQPPLLL